MVKDYYAVLGVARDANREDIRRSYRLLARLHHPDRAGPDPVHEERFKKVAEAFRTLGDEVRRRAYDALLERAHARPELVFHDLTPFFPEWRRIRVLPEKVAQRTEMMLSAEEVAVGTYRQLQIPLRVCCPLCGGDGYVLGRACSQCRRTGRVERELCLPLSLPAGTPDGAVRRLVLFGGSLEITLLVRHAQIDPSASAAGSVTNVMG